MSALRTKSYLLLLIASAIWGIAGPIIKYTLTYFPASIFLVYRFALSASFACLTLGFTHHKGWPKSPKQQFWILVYAILNTTLALGLLFLGYERTSAIAGSIINAIYPIIVAVTGVWLLKERVTHRETIGMSIALAGTGLTFIEPFLTSQSLASSSSTLTGNLLVLASLAIGVLGAVMAKLLLRTQLSPFALTQFSFLVGFITLLPLVFFYYSVPEILHYLKSAPLLAHVGVWYMAFLSGTIAYTLWHIGQKSIEIGETALFSYIYPIFTAPLSLFWLHERLSWVYFLSAALITAGVIVAQQKPKHPQAHRR